MKKNPSLKIFQPVVAAVLAIIIAWGLSVRPAQAAGYVLTLQQVGPNVVATGSGALDLTGLTFIQNSTGGSGEVGPIDGTILTGAPASYSQYLGPTGPHTFGSGGIIFANSGTGGLVGIVNSGVLEVPVGYASNSLLSDTATYNSKTINSLGATPGVYEWTWGSGADQNFTLDVVPEPSTWIGAGLAGLMLIVQIAKARSFSKRSNGQAEIFTKGN
jgi:hypothetical protein